jgi:AcrR family transcriptional regulator
MPTAGKPDPHSATGLLRAFRDQSFQLRLSSGPPIPGEGLRERKKRLMKQLISDTATAMFLDRGFDEVRVVEVAEACGVSEKTIFNYFSTKESLLLDREEAMTAGIRSVLGPTSAHLSPVDAAVSWIADDVQRFSDYWKDQERSIDVTTIRRFAELIEQTASLRAAQRDMMDRLVTAAAEAMAARAGVDPNDPEPQIAATAIVGLWRVQFQAMWKHADGRMNPEEVREAVMAEVRRAARLIDTGLWSFGLVVQGSNGREQLKAAAEAANEARKQVLTAIRQARAAWREVREGQADQRRSAAASDTVSSAAGSASRRSSGMGAPLRTDRP